MLNLQLKMLRKELGLTQVEFAEKIGVTQGTYTKYESGDVDLSSDKIIKIKEIWNISFEWLLEGKGEMFNNSEPVPLRSGGVIANTDDFIYVPLFDEVKAAAGTGAYVANEDSSSLMCFRKDWAYRHNIALNQLSTIYAYGDSMFPTITNGDVLLIDHSQTTPKLDRIFVIRINDSIVVKRMGNVSKNKMILISDNPIVSQLSIDMAVEDIAIIGRVVWFGRVI